MRRVSSGSCRHPRGVTLIELMFSMGIALVGLVGIMALIPVASYQASAGLTADRMGRLGANAERDFDIRGYRSPRMWVSWRPAANTFAPVSTPPPPAVAFCIDPRFVAHHHYVQNTYTTNPATPARLFPYYTTIDPVNEVRMERVGVLSSPLPPQALMNVLQANNIFVSKDDLAIERPRDSTVPARQVYGDATNPLVPPFPGPDNAWGFSGVDDDNNGTPDDVSEAMWFGSDDIGMRQFNGQMSWMATLAPTLRSVDTGFNVGGVEISPFGPEHDTYTLSIVLFNQRNPVFPLAVDDPKDPNTERLVNVAPLGGSDFLLTLRDNTRPRSDLVLRDGDWLMLSAPSASEHYLPDGTFSGRIPAIRWYRVLSTDAEVELSNGLPGRHATLQGADWLPPPGMRTQATLVSGVVGVFEKTVRLETTSLWGN